ncbi:hypothetical protein C7S18_01410 [Ahniella affigens]|uniref:Protein kinase domain-containing protein n=1 Tax=Ahniella affigens TaxID=2021234 RepID=A0A2P1PM73_9GAMM|nr:serine/threonine-protein kinase [Ahniella affigens]AVP95936.1 hypothetical protein C7S18_01410 [Ahniella affigens]
MNANQRAGAGRTSSAVSDEPTTEPLSNALSAIADQAPVAWDLLAQTSLQPGELEGLRLIEDVARAFRGQGMPGETETRPVAFTWNGLQVTERLGAGSYGDVWRAFDPWLEREVALKLFRGHASAGLDEARRLARLRHHNVLSVLGCAIADDRAGLWSELIEGNTLADLITRGGPLSAAETMRVGRDLAQALVAVHGAGLVHGDIKASNVMRERGGRIVLMDFGAGGEARLLAAQRVRSGTLAYLAPEVLDGAPASQQSDLFALIVLLHLLYRGHLPWSADSALELRRAQNVPPQLLPKQGDPIEQHLCRMIAQGLSVDPRKRVGDAQSLARCLQIQTNMATPVAPIRRHLGLAIAASAVLALGIFGWMLRPDWRTDVKFVRLGESGPVSLEPDASVRAGDRLRLQFESNRQVYAYVLNEDDQGIATVLFPLSDRDNPLPAAKALELPGGVDSGLAWEVGASGGQEEFLIVASAEPLTNLEQALADWRRARGVQRSVDQIVTVAPPELSGAQLNALVRSLEGDVRPESVQKWQFRFTHTR